ncbi:MAG: hypothetical protein HND44_07905 [Chloroflexi bacterium]|nr:hypothetical protein [Chloroflexota bacterium]NOG34488.1 hypothetical protein [Chloroflexota bacterium]
MGIKAQETPPEPISSPEPTAPEQPDMAYQPPADADDLADFIPPATEIIEAPPAEPITPTLPVSPTIPFTPTVGITATTAVTITEPITKLVSFEEGKIAVVFEEDTITDTAEIQLTTLPLPQNPLTATNTVSNPLESLVLQKFQIEVVQEGEIVSAEFSKPVRLIVDLRSWMQELDASYQTWTYYLAYQDKNDPGIWIEVPLDVYQPDGLLSAEVTHFSNWAAGVRPDRWNPSWTPPTVSAFSGAVTYNYPLELPPGRRGLQPAVSLSYSSRGLDGRIRDGESGPLGDGWSLGGISVVRVGVTMDSFYGVPRTVHPDKFRLVFNGTGHELFPAAGANTTTDATVRYAVKDAPGYYLERNYSASTPNTDGIYWILITPDGTRYRLGYFADAEEWQHVGWSGNMSIAGHPGHTPGGYAYSAIAWHVDTVTDAFGNQMTYHYHTWEHAENIQWWNTDHWTSFTLTTRKNRINDIKYNYPTRVTSLPAADTVARLTSTPATRIEFRSSNPTYFPTLINSIFIYHGGGALPTSEYRIDTAGVLVDSPGCINYDTQPNTYRQSHTRIVKSIRRWVNVDGNAATNDANGYGLPPTTFYYGNNLGNQNEYNPLAHFIKNSQPCFRFLYLHGYKNGYGGSARFTYSADNRSVGEYLYHTYNRYTWPTIGYSYVVHEMRLNDGRNADLLTTYIYTKRCYAQWGSVPAGAVNCAEANAPEEYGPLVGHETTTQTSYDYNGTTILHKQITTFSQNANNSLGRPTQIDVQNGAGTLLTRTDHTYASLAINGVANMFTYTSETKNYQYNSGAGSTTLSTKTTYEYNTANQGGSQYGNLTHIREFDSASAATPHRATIRAYFPRADLNGSGVLTINGHWLVGLAATEGLYAGNFTTLIRGSWTYFDGASSHSTAPTQGAPSRSRAFIETTCAAVPGGGGGGCTYAYQTIDTTYAYDLYGNQTGITTHNGYGYRTFNSSWQELVSAYPGNGRTTTIAYENGYNLYPVSTTFTPLNQTTTFQIYGFNGVGVSGFQKQPGLLKQVTGPDSVTTRYEYDPFGRLHAVYDGDTTYNGTAFAGFEDTDPWNGDPVTVYRYWDTSWNNGTTFLNPAGNAPFIISQQQRPGSFPTANSSSGFAFADQTFYDGFGRPIQTRSLWHWVEGQSLSREIISHTNYGANGQVSCQSTPYDVPYYSDQPKTWPASPFYTASNCGNKPHTTSTYDALGRPLTVTGPDGNATNYFYYIVNTVTVDGRNLMALTNIKDANNHITQHFTNSLGQMAMVREVSGTDPYTNYADTRYYYDEAGNLDEVRQSNPSSGDPGSWLARTTMTYDGFGRKTSMNDPDMGVWTYAYDAAGNLTKQLDANGDRLCFYYDSLNRLTGKYHDAAQNGCANGAVQLAAYTYYTSGAGKVGKPYQIYWSSSSTQNKETFDYDSLGRLIIHDRWVDGRNYEMSYAGFDALHRPTSRTIMYPNGNTEQLNITYDHEGENSLAVQGGSTLVEAIGYNDMGQIKRVALGNNLTTWYGYLGYSASGNNDAYDATWGQFGQLWRICTAPDASNRCTYTNRDTTPLEQRLDLRYTYDNVGNVTAILDKLDSGQIQNFGYDHLNRLTSASTNGVGTAQYNHTYGYNKLGNLTNYDGAGYTYGSSLHKHAVTNANGVNFTYDANGNMTFRDAAGAANDYTQNFNVENELVSVVNNGNTTTFAYDANGIRTKAVAPSGVTTYYPFPGYEEEVNGSTTTRRITYSTAGQAVALRVQVVSGSNTLYYLHTDHLGSTSLATTTSGNVISGSTARYYPFGDWRTEPTANLTDRGFTGHLHNNIGNAPDDIGLVYMQARWYLPGLGRFASADTIVPNPANPQSYNRYSYVENRPLNRIDPTGHVDCGLLGDAGDTQACHNAAPPQLVNFTGGNWAAKEKGVIQTGAWDVAMALYKASEGQYGSPSETFKAVYGGAVTFHKTGTDGCPDKVCYGEWVGNNKINVYTDVYDKNDNSKIPSEWAGPRWAVHELGHGFEAKVNDILGIEHVRNNLPVDFANRDGFAGDYPGWQQNDCEVACNGEIYADMFVGWTYNRWDTGEYFPEGQAKANYMTTNMAVWIDIVAQR